MKVEEAIALANIAANEVDEAKPATEKEMRND